MLKQGCIPVLIPKKHVGMMKLVDVLDLGSSALCVGVRVPLPTPVEKSTIIQCSVHDNWSDQPEVSHNVTYCSRLTE